MRMHSPDELGQMAEVRAPAWRAVHRRRGDDGRRAHGPALGPSGGRDRTRPDLRRPRRWPAECCPWRRPWPRPRVVAAWDTADRSRTFFHGHSFTAHPLACAVAVANWKMLTAAPPLGPRRMERFWNEALAPLRSHPRVRESAFAGSSPPWSSTCPAATWPPSAASCARRAWKRGCCFGRWARSFTPCRRFAPPMNRWNTIAIDRAIERSMRVPDGPSRHPPSRLASTSYDSRTRS